MFFVCGIWCVADVSSVSPSSEQTVFFKTSLPLSILGCVMLIFSVMFRDLLALLFQLNEARMCGKWYRALKCT